MSNIVFFSSRKWRKFEDRVKDITESVLFYFKKENYYIEINLVDNKTIQLLNKKWRGISKPTNVLSFSRLDDWPDKNYLGEVFLAPQYIEEKKENFEFLLIHGLLHILGFGHTRKGDRIKMEYYEKRLLQWHKKHSLL